MKVFGFFWEFLFSWGVYSVLGRAMHAKCRWQQLTLHAHENPELQADTFMFCFWTMEGDATISSGCFPAFAARRLNKAGTDGQTGKLARSID